LSNSLVIIPTFNEKENVRDIIESIHSLSKDFDILIVDDNSPDGTAGIVKELQKSLNDNKFTIHLMEREGKQGLGTAYIDGFKFAIEHGYDYIFEMDADFSHDPKDLEVLFEACAYKGVDLAIGSRYVGGVNVVNWPMSRVLLSYFASKYVHMVTGMPVKDATAGFKCYKRNVLEAINFDKIRSIGYAFQIEMKFTSWKYGFKLKEVPIIFRDRERGRSKMSINIFNEALFGVIKMKIDSFFRSYQYTHPGIQPVTETSRIG
jgi:dolichol-phosphate mannosyltransferase